MRRIHLAIPLLGVLSLACQDIPAPNLETGPSLLISDAGHSGIDGFYFLPPLVRNVQPVGAFDPSHLAQLQVIVCEWDGTHCVGAPVAMFSSTTGTGSEILRIGDDGSHYIVNWHTKASALDPATPYRLFVSSGFVELGFADIDVVSSGKELKQVDTGQYIALKNGRTLPIKFTVTDRFRDPYLIAYYPFDGDAADASGNEHHGVLSALAPTFGGGVFGQAVVFTDSSYVQVEASPMFDTHTFTLAAWFSPTALNGFRAIAAHGESLDTDKIQYGLFVFDGDVYGWYEEPDDTDIDLRAPITVGWHHVALTRDDAGTYTLYLDGVGVQARLNTPAPASIVSFFMIGARTNTVRTPIQSHFLGSIDEVYVFSRALSEQEIVQLMNGGGGN